MTGPLMGAVGDSYTAGFGGNPAGTWDYDDAWWRHTARVLGWRVGDVTATPGGGYQQPGDFGTFAHQLTAHPLDPATDFVLLQGGLNDGNGPAVAGQARAVRDLITLALQQAPAAQVIVLGVFCPFTDRVPTATTLPIARATASPAALGPAVRFLDPFLLQFDLAADGVHPSATGHRQIGEWVARRLQTNLEQGTPLRLDASGAYWS